ncbi:hypothetical protein T05_11420, partial [Trichinella murrelli]
LEHPVATRVDTLTFHLPESVVPSTTWTVAVLDRRFGRLTMDHFGSGLYS